MKRGEQARVCSRLGNIEVRAARENNLKDVTARDSQAQAHDLHRRIAVGGFLEGLSREVYKECHRRPHRRRLVAFPSAFDPFQCFSVPV